jgi:hypothetical protein
MKISPKATKTAPAKAATVPEYLAGLTPEKRAVITAARKLVRANIPKGDVLPEKAGRLKLE